MYSPFSLKDQKYEAGTGLVACTVTLLVGCGLDCRHSGSKLGDQLILTQTLTSTRGFQSCDSFFLYLDGAW